MGTMGGLSDTHYFRIRAQLADGCHIVMIRLNAD